jgi:hypothetical protein
MPLERISQHVELGLLKLAPDFWGKPRIGAALAAVLREIQTLEDVIWDQFEAQHIDTAERTALATMGKLIGQASPQGFSVEQYRTIIKARALANRSNGTGPEIGRVAVALYGAENTSFVWAGPAVIYLTVLTGLTDAEVDMAAAVLPYATGAGVQLHLLYGADEDIMLWGDGTWSEDWAGVEEI